MTVKMSERNKGGYKYRPFRPSDGGRKKAGFSGTAGDCTIRALAIATKIPYATAYERMNRECEKARGRYKRYKGHYSHSGISPTIAAKELMKHNWHYLRPAWGLSSCNKLDTVSKRGRFIIAITSNKKIKGKYVQHCFAYINGVVVDRWNWPRYLKNDYHITCIMGDRYP